MSIVEINDKEKYNSVIVNQKHSQFLQSWEWGEFQKTAGLDVKRFGFEDNGKFILVFTLIKKSLGLGKNYFYCPRIELRMKSEELRIIFNKLEEIAKKENVIFLRFEPIDNLTPTLSLESRGGIKKTIDVQPSRTIILDLEKSEEELLASMHQKTRYNARLAEKKGVKIRIADTHLALSGTSLQEGSKNDFEDFWKLMEQTVDRDGFRLHGKEYYKKMLAGDFVKLYLAEYEGGVIAGNIIAFFGDTATYVHGASGNKDRNVMTPYLLQWEIIKQAKTAGYKYYDFYGIDENKWPGVTRFKRGFGGEEANYPGTFDLAFSELWYNVYKLIRRLRRLI